MKKLICSVLALAAGALLPLSAADETRTIRLVQDDAQVRMVTKVYPMKYVKALDIQPFVAAAVHRYTQLSSVRAQNYSAGKIQYLLEHCHLWGTGHVALGDSRPWAGFPQGQQWKPESDQRAECPSPALLLAVGFRQTKQSSLGTEAEAQNWI